jgi:hypothetical protein
MVTSAMLAAVLALVLASCAPAEVEFPDADDTNIDTNTGDTGGDTDIGDSDDTDVDSDTAPLESIVGTATAVIVETNPNAAAVTVTLDHDADVWVSYGAEGAQTTPTRRLSANVSTEILVLGLKSGLTTALVVHAEADGAEPWESEAIVLDVPALPRDFQRCIASTFLDRHEPEEVYCTNGVYSSSGTYNYFCVDHLGDVVYRIEGTPNELVYGVTPLMSGGWAGVSTTNSVLFLYDAKGDAVAQLSPIWLRERTTWQHDYIDNHEVIEITEGDWIGALAFITGTWEYSWTYGWVYSQGIVVFDPAIRRVLWDWTSAGDTSDGVAGDALLDYGRSAYGSFTSDFGHGNSLAFRVDDHGRKVFWMSMRSQSWIVKIDVETSSIMWRFGHGGDFALVDDIDSRTPTALPAEEWFYGEHEARFVEFDGDRTTFTLFDNGFYRMNDAGEFVSDAYSRMVEYRLDETSMLGEIVWEYGPRDGTDPDYLYAWGMGGAQKLPDGARAAWASGYGVGNGWGGPFLREVSYPEGELLWSYDCVDYGAGFYRVAWYPSLYEFDYLTAQ